MVPLAVEWHPPSSRSGQSIIITDSPALDWKSVQLIDPAETTEKRHQFTVLTA